MKVKDLVEYLTTLDQEAVVLEVDYYYGDYKEGDPPHLTLLTPE